MIKTKLIFVAILGASVILPAAAKAQGISVRIGDRPYYNHGARYWDGDYQMVWVPGHMSRHGWVHGHYVRGEHRRHEGRFDRHDDRRDSNRYDDRQYSNRRDDDRR